VDFSGLIDNSRLAAGGLRDFAFGMVNPSLRLGVTGLSRSGKTVFITALVQALLKGGRLPAFEAMSDGRLQRTFLEPQPDDELPRFAYENNLALLTGAERRWPPGTTGLSQLRLTLEYAPRGFLARSFGSGKLHVDIVDYPGEWLLDLPLMNMSFAAWSAATLAASRKAPREDRARDWHEHLMGLSPMAAANEVDAMRAAALFTSYLQRCRNDAVSLSALPPGRFLMPGDFAGSPLLAFAPLDVAADAVFPRGSLGALMERRYRSYVERIVKPFFFGHFARLDRQIVLVDALSALNGGAAAVADLQEALTGILGCFRQGANSLASLLFGHRIDRILFAATKADLLHHDSHDRLAAVLRLVVEAAARRAAFSGAIVETAAIAAVRTTREARVRRRGEDLPCIAGTPEAGEVLGDTRFDGATEAAVFPGDLPADPAAALDGSLEGRLRFLRFRPPEASGATLPHIRLDRAIEFLIGDYLA
jgi:predicted YcjX-like family ATPase